MDEKDTKMASTSGLTEAPLHYAPVAQMEERWNAKPFAVNSSLIRRTILFHGYSAFAALSSRNRQTREGQADYTRKGNRHYTPSRASVKGGPVNILKTEKKLAVISALTEGCSIRSIVRMTGVHKKTIMKLLVEVGTRCQQMMDERMRGLRFEAVECDEIWTFVGKKEAVIKVDERNTNPELGNQYTQIALDPVSKMIPAFHVGKRDSVNTHHFIEDLSRRIDGSTQVSTDAWGPYSPAIARYFGNRATYATITKFYASENPGAGRYAPSRVSGSQITEVLGVPDYSKVCTSYVERQNLTLRMKIARFHRLSLAFSQKLANLKAAVALYFWSYNFCLIHRSLRMTPAMAAGITDRLWGLEELLTA